MASVPYDISEAPIVRRDDSCVAFLRRVSWWLIAFNALAILVLEVIAPLPFATDTLALPLLAVLIFGGIAAVYTRRRPNSKFAGMAQGLMQILLFTAVGTVLSYLFARHGGPLWDGTLYQWDQALGFDWLAYVRWVDQHAWLVLIYRLAYLSIVPQLALLVIVQGIGGRLSLMHQTLFAVMLCGTITVFLSPLLPAESNYVFLNLGASDFQNIRPVIGFTSLFDFDALRSGQMHTLDLTRMEGIVAFPSYHAGLATITLWSFLRTPGLRIGGAILALLTFAATPVDGGHYITDIIAGTLIAIGCIAVSGYIMGRGLQPRPMRRELDHRHTAIDV